MELNDMNPRKRLSRVGIALFVMTTLFHIVGNVLYVIIYKNWPEITNTDWFSMAFNAFMLVVVALPPYYIIISTISPAPKKKFVRLNGSTFMGIFIACAALMYLSNIFGVYINFNIADIIGKDLLNPLMEATTESSFISVFIYAVVIAPFVEELIFRKLMLDRLRIFGDAPAILLTGIAFGLYHRNTFQLFYACMLGLVFAHIALTTNSIRYTVILHMMINFVGTAASMFIDNIAIVMLLGLWVIGSIIAGTIIFISKCKNITMQRGEITINDKSVYILNTGTLLFVTTCVAIMVLSIITVV